MTAPGNGAGDLPGQGGEGAAPGGSATPGGAPAATGSGEGGQRFAIVVGRFYEDLADRLISGAQRAFVDATGGAADVFEVPGAFELPLAAAYLAATGNYAGIACLGAVIRGETSHYDFVCAESARGIQDVQLRTGVPCAFGVLTVENMDQALARSGGGKRDQGEHAAQAVIALAGLKKQLGV